MLRKSRFELSVALRGEWIQFNGFNDSTKKVAGFKRNCSGR